MRLFRGNRNIPRVKGVFNGKGAVRPSLEPNQKNEYLHE
jgi:hypothetical protein